MKRGLVLKSAIKVFRVLKSNIISREVKFNLFLADIGIVLAYNASTLSMTISTTTTLNTMLDRALTTKLLLRYAIKMSREDHFVHVDLCRTLP